MSRYITQQYRNCTVVNNNLKGQSWKYNSHKINLED